MRVPAGRAFAEAYVGIDVITPPAANLLRSAT